MCATARVAGALTAAALAGSVAARAQGTHLSALERSIPAGLAEPTAGAALGDLQAIWSDPTATLSSGAFAGLYQSSYAGVRLHQLGAAFRWGLRWSVVIGSTEIDDLFDSSLVAADPGLAALRVRALTAGLDATVQWRALRGSLGLGYAADETLGALSSSTIARAHLRVFPFRSHAVTVGLRFKRAVAGSIEPNGGGGEGALDVAVTGAAEFWRVSLGAAVTHGAVWRHSEVGGGAGVAGRVDLWSRLSVSAGMGRYTATYGADRHLWHRSIGAGVALGGFAVDARLTGTALGVGSGLGITVGYTPGGRSPANFGSSPRWRFRNSS